MRLSVAAFVLVLILDQAAFGVHHVERSVDEGLLPYQFRTHTVINLTQPGSIEPMPIRGQDRMGAWEVGNQWHNDSLSFILFWRDFLTGEVINQVNRRVWSFMSNVGADMDADGEYEIAVTYQVENEVYIEIVEVGGKTEYKRRLFYVRDNNGNGRWDGHCYAQALEDLNGDDTCEVLIYIFSAFDLTPRSFLCLDWRQDSILWNYEITGYPAGHAVLRDTAGRFTGTGICVWSMGNDVTTATKDDRHSYLICLDESGNEVWAEVLGGTFSAVHMEPFDSDGDGSPEMLTVTNFGEADSAGVRGSLIGLYATDGNLFDTLRLPVGPAVRQLSVCDIDADGVDEILVCTSDNLVHVLNKRLQELSRHLFDAEPSVWKTADFVGNGKHQLIASTVDGMTYLLDEDFDLLAQYDGLFDFRFSHTFTSDVSPSGLTMLLASQSRSRSTVAYFEKQPFLAILTTFMVRHQRTFLLILGGLAAALVATNYHRRRIKRNLDLISRQRDELEQTRNDLQKTMADLVTAQTQLVQSEKMASLGMLVAGIAHEINNALGALTSSNNTAYRAMGHLRQRVADLGREEPRLAELTDKLEVAEASSRSVGDGADAIAGIVRRLRSFARLDEAELQRVDLHECLDETVGLAHHQMKQNILINKEYGDVPKIACYPSQLNQVFLNLLTNARESIQGRGEITIRTYTEGPMAVIVVADTGVGMPPERLDKVFDPGFTTKGVGVGTGLGLAICYQIVRDHQGDISVDSDIGKGTTFTIRLPLDIK